MQGMPQYPWVKLGVGCVGAVESACPSKGYQHCCSRHGHLMLCVYALLQQSWWSEYTSCAYCTSSSAGSC